MRPGADDPLRRRGEVRDQPRHRVRIAIGPAAARQNRRGDGAVIFGHRSLFPAVPPPLLGNPAGHEQRQSSSRACHISRQRGPTTPGSGGCAPKANRVDPQPKVLVRSATHEMAVVGVAIIGRTGRHDGLQRRRASGSDLQSVEPTPGNADHPHGPAAPGSRGEPGNHLDRVALFLRQVFVQEKTVAVTRSAHVLPDARKPVLRVPSMHLLVAEHSSVAPTVGQVFQDGGHRFRMGTLWQPDGCRKPRAVRERNPDRVEPLDPGQARYLHPRISATRSA